MEREELVISTKNKKLRWILFILAFLIAVTAFGYGVSRMGYQEPGLQEIEAEPDEEAPMYASGYHLFYEFNGSSDEIKAAKNRLRDDWSHALIYAYKLLDARNEYDGYVNIAYINHHPGEEIAVSEELSAILNDAAEKEDAEVYSPYYGPVFGLWHEILYLDEPQASDPLNDPWQKERLERIVPLLNSENAELRISADKVKLSLSNALSDELDALEMSREIIDLGLMHDAYLVKLVREQLNRQGWTNGYLETDDGMILSLGEHSGETFLIYAYRDGEPAENERITAEGDFVCSRIKSFSLGEPGYYTIEKDDEVYFRHPYISVSGYPEDRYMITYWLDSNGDPLMAAYQNLILQAGKVREPHSGSYYLQEKPTAE